MGVKAKNVVGIREYKGLDDDDYESEEELWESVVLKPLR